MYDRMPATMTAAAAWPAFSARLAHTLLTQSPRHAWAQVTGAAPEAESEAMDVGTVAHAWLLEGQAALAVIEAPDYRTKAARKARDAARSEGKSPILAHKWAEVQAMVAAVHEQLEQIEGGRLLQPEGGIAEQSLYWTEPAGVACRATPDWLSLDHRTLVDLKTTAGSAHPAAFSRTLWDRGYALQAALYRRAVQVVHGVTAEFLFVVAETAPPYAVSVVALDPEAEAFADTQLTEALRIWQTCLATNTWPAYPPRVAYAECPPWVQAQWLTRSYYQEATR